MPATTFTCPDCDAVLKLAAAVPAGKKIKCPKCGSIFGVPADGPPAASAIRAGDDTALPVRRKKPVRDEDDGWDDDETPAARRAVRRPAAEDDYPRRTDADEGDDYDLPRSRRLDRKKKKAGKGLLVGLIVGGVLLLLGVGAIAGWVWPGFFKGGGGVKDIPAPAAVEDLLAFAPQGSDLFMGFDLEAMRKHQAADSDAQMNLAFAQLSAMIPNAPPAAAMTYVFKNADRMVVAVNLQNPQVDLKVAVIARMKAPFTAEEIRKLFNAPGPLQQQNGKSYVKLAPLQAPQGVGRVGRPQGVPPAAQKTPFLCMPTNDTLVWALVPENQVGALLNGSGKQESGSEARVLARSVGGSNVWVAWSFNGMIRQALMQVNPQMLQMMAPEFQPCVGALRQLKGTIATMDYEAGGNFKMRLGLNCANAGDAQQLAGATQNWWNAKVKPQADMIANAAAMAGNPEMPAAVREFFNSIAFRADGTQAQATAQISRATLEKVEKAQPKLGGPFMNQPNQNPFPNQNPNQRRRPFGR